MDIPRCRVPLHLGPPTDCEVEAINRRGGFIVLSDGSVAYTCNWFDGDGDECQESEAVTCVARDAYGGFWTVLLSEFEDVETH